MLPVTNKLHETTEKLDRYMENANLSTDERELLEEIQVMLRLCSNFLNRCMLANQYFSDAISVLFESFDFTKD